MGITQIAADHSQWRAALGPETKAADAGDEESCLPLIAIKGSITKPAVGESLASSREDLGNPASVLHRRHVVISASHRALRHFDLGRRDLLIGQQA